MNALEDRSSATTRECTQRAAARESDVAFQIEFEQVDRCMKRATARESDVALHIEFERVDRCMKKLACYGYTSSSQSDSASIRSP